jgi:SlyX protein
MDTLQNIETRLVDLEIKASFTEDLVEQLNQIIVRQQQQIEALTRELLALRERPTLEGAGPGFRSLRDDLPPHY